MKPMVTATAGLCISTAKVISSNRGDNWGLAPKTLACLMPLQWTPKADCICIADRNNVRVKI